MSGSKLSCSFCGKDKNRVRMLISAPAEVDARKSMICNECVGVCVSILREERQQSGSDRLKVERNELNWLERLLKRN
jgi:ATP-dependent protease Clp ATPase subunit